MKSLTVLFIITLLLSCSEKKNKTQIIKKDTTVVSNKSNPKSDFFEIHEDGFGEIKIGDDYEKLKQYIIDNHLTYKHLNQDTLDEFSRIFYIYDDTSVIASISNNNAENLPLKIKFFGFLSEKFHTSNGIHKGMSLKELSKIIPKILIEYNFMDDYYFVSLKNKNNNAFIINIEFDNKQIKNKSLEDINKNLDKIDGKISFIGIWED